MGPKNGSVPPVLASRTCSPAGRAGRGRTEAAPAQKLLWSACLRAGRSRLVQVFLTSSYTELKKPSSRLDQPRTQEGVGNLSALFDAWPYQEATRVMAGFPGRTLLRSSLAILPVFLSLLV